MCEYVDGCNSIVSQIFWKIERHYRLDVEPETVVNTSDVLHRIADVPYLPVVDLYLPTLIACLMT